MQNRTKAILSVVVASLVLGLVGCSGGSADEDMKVAEPGTESKNRYKVGDDSTTKSTAETATE